MRPFLLCLVLISCAPPLPLEGAPCPCVEGWVCCPGIKLCAVELALCEGVRGPEISPPGAEVGVGRSLQFTSSAQGVTWELEEGALAGSIDASGLYVAPLQPMQVHVVARSALGATRASVTVRELRLSLLAGDYGGPADVPIDGVGQFARVSRPHDGVFVGGAYFFLDDVEVYSPTLSFHAWLRRLDPVTQQVETLFKSTFVASVDGPKGVGQFNEIGALSTGGPDSLLVVDRGCLRELRTVDLSLSTVLCSDAGSFFPYRAIIGGPQAFYASKLSQHVLVRLDRDGGPSRSSRGLRACRATPMEMRGS